MNISNLLKKRQALIRELAEFPPTTEKATTILESQILILDMQIECERRRLDLRTTIAMSRKRISIVVEGGLEKETVKTFFGWEAVDKAYSDAITDRETRALEYYTKLINEAQKP